MSALTSEAVSRSFAFGPYLLLPEQGVLLENGRTVRIGRRALDLLKLLVEQRGQLVGKQELMAYAWPGLTVEEGNLKVNIAGLRRVLGEGSGPPLYIATVIGRGYRFVAPVQVSLPRVSAPALTLPTAGNLPRVTKSILGRDDVIRAILHDLETGRLVSIVGPGGAGKTTVALAVAERAGSAGIDGAWLVDLSELDSSADLDAVVANVLRAGEGAPGDALPDHNMLLLLDNCEHLIDTVAVFADRILTRRRNVKLLATSREPLCIRGERVRRLHGLGLPARVEPLTAEQALVYPAVQLFAERAANTTKSFRLDDTNAAHVVAICHRLDGLALAIERVAPRVGALGIAGLREHLERRFHMFDGYHEGPERHRTLTANVHASYALLAESERCLLCRLATFTGAFSLEAACDIGVRADLERSTVVRDIASLVSKSLLVAELHEGHMQYRLAQVTRAFALEKLREHGEEHDAPDGSR